MTATKQNASDLIEKAAELSKQFAKDAGERELQGGTPKVQRDQIRESGLLKVLIPEEFGGDGQPWSTVLRIVREIAKGDSSLAHLYGYHFLSVSSPYIKGTPEQAAHFFTETAKNNAFWGNSSNPLHKELFGKRQSDGSVILNGNKTFCSGSPDADFLWLTWIDEDDGEYYHSAIPASRKGITVHDDWNGFGQRLTGSGSVVYDNVVVRPDEVVENFRKEPSLLATITPQMSQSILSNVFIGTAEGALAEAKKYSLTKSRAWITSGLKRAADDPGILRQYGELWTELQGAISLVEKANRSLDRVWEAGAGLTEEERGKTAVDVAAANILSGNVALKITSKIFEIMGARSATRDNDFDRFWRNVRTHTLHNPAEFKLRNIGNWYLNDQVPEPHLYA